MKRSIIMAVLGLCATHSESATIITALPYTVTALGTYVLNANLTLPDPNGVAVLVDTAVKGPVVVDLRGFTLTGTSGGNSIGVAVGREAINPGGADYPVNLYPITVRNGKISNFTTGVFAGIGSHDLTNLAFSHLTITPSGTLSGYGFAFHLVDHSTIDQCTVLGGSVGILEQFAGLRNVYTNCTFNLCDTILEIVPELDGIPRYLSKYELDPVPTTASK